MGTRQCFQVLVCFILVLNVCHNAVEALSAPCTTPTRQPGMCVSIEECRNIYNIVNSPTPPAAGIANYIKRAACTLPHVKRSVCCQLREVVPSSTSPSGSTVISMHPKLNLLPSDCGLSIADRLVYGSAAQVFEYPWMAILRYDYNGTIKDGCSGTLITKRYILTAAHCVKTRSTVTLHSVVLGEHTKNQEIDCNVYHDGEEIERDCADPIEVYGIESFVIHSDYNRPKYSNDIALIRLDEDAKMKDNIRPICLPSTEDLQKIAFDKYLVTGWATTGQHEGSDMLQKAVLPYVNISDCQRKMNEYHANIQLSDKQMCAGGINKADTCNGDSGGPLGFNVGYNGGRFMQFGVVSRGADACGEKELPGIYCRVAAYMDWILDNMKA